MVDDLRLASAPALRSSLAAFSHRPTGRNTAGLAALGLVLLAQCLYVAFIIPRTPQYMADPRSVLIDRLPLWRTISVIPVPYPTTAAAGVLAVLASAVVLLAAYALALRLSWRLPATTGNVAIVVGFGLLFSLTFALALPNSGSDDVLSYVKQARLSTVYHSNPYTVPPAPLTGDPYVPFGPWPHRGTPYGPVWTYLAIAWQSALGEDVVRNLLGFRFLLFGLNLGTAALVWAIAGTLDPTHRLASIAFYTWNPIVMLNGQDHVDTAMAFLLMVAVYLWVARREWLAVVALTLSVLVKFLTFPLLGAYLLGRWRGRSRRAAVLAAALAVVVVVAAFIPVWGGWGGLLQLTRGPGNPNPGGLLTPRRLVFTPIFLALVAWVGWRSPDDVVVSLRGWAVAMLCFCWFFVPDQFAWYLMTFVAVAAVAGSGQIAGVALVLCVGATLTNTLGQTAQPYTRVPAILLEVSWWGPPLAALAWIAALRWELVRRAGTRSGRVPTMDRAPIAPAMSDARAR